MENEHLLDLSTDNISPSSSTKDQSPTSFSRDLIGRLGILSQGTETVISKTQNICAINQSSVECVMFLISKIVF